MRLRLLGCAVLLFTGAAQADDGVPALLQFAEQYQRQNIGPATEKTAPDDRESGKKKREPAKRLSDNSQSASPAKTFTLSQELLARDQQLARQRMALTALRQELAALRAEKAAPPVAALPDSSTLQQWIAGLGAAWRGSPDAQRAEALLRQATQETAKSRATAAQAERRVTELESAAQASAQTLAQRQREHQEALHALRAALEESEQKRAGEQKATQQAREDLLALRKRLQWEMTPEQLKDERKRLSYAAGSALGRDIQGLMTERQSWGVPVERDSLLAGVIDSVSGRLQLPPDELNTLTAQADAAAVAAREKRVNQQRRRDEDYLAQFSQQKGVKQSAMGFWYRVDYAGEGALAPTAVVDVVVKEKLTDGTVIQDMDLSGKVLSQPLSEYPPLFREAISHLHNHGSLTMVVPPALAYGETGYPPKVPPNATMVYELRIDNSQAPAKGVQAVKREADTAGGQG
ncbi:FKBP-type peptidyl-prolyl cis-trans isomerase N-terminal domain-containing protein [Serratia marcescens]|uniref:FKBP-type peptidyl-prolyl cis-trans isomerase N-terminal domain-containing protein n=1 Tax=Serratia marcescens TaxID=615 RepID=UPI0027546248|nr:FKBP-type peptidyl-prolyl cis-trans isomerase N-terminal domain-containing protein [Serratia marcescens]MDP8634706.1 FKBP-type peptidyl-prolyl cis-trans isomerase N-terminal domain-containing protein [Serratia marcescens]MDP8868207.1 FKBP-type peptidyl-prolyl cis-trans isomerase N-terminal domain-containing protein [Serratia marcescens]